MVFNKLDAMSKAIGLNVGVLASVLAQAKESKGQTCIIEYHGEKGYNLVVTCLDSDVSDRWRWDVYFSFDFFKGRDVAYTIDCGVDLADLDTKMFKEYYLRIGETDWKRVQNGDSMENLVQLQAF